MSAHSSNAHTVNTVKEVADLLTKNFEKTREKKYKVSDNVFGRVVNYITEEDRKTLDRNCNQKNIFAFGNDCVERLLDTPNPRDFCLELGLPLKWMEKKILNGFHFELVLFEKSDEMVPFDATWEGVKKLLQKNYPSSVHELYSKHLKDLKETDYKDIEDSSDFSDIHDNRFTDSRFVGLERLVELAEKNEATLSNLRMFLFTELCMNSLYKGTGYTFNEETQEYGFKEYFIRNIYRKDMDQEKSAFLPLKVEI